MARRKKRLPGFIGSAPIARLTRFGNPKFITTRSRVVSKKGYAFIEKRPFVSFFTALGVLLLLILLGSTIFRTRTVKDQQQEMPKSVSVYSYAEEPTIAVQGSVKKSGVVQIVAQTPGIVSAINFQEGKEVAKGKVLLNLSSNYQGGNAFSLQRRLAGVQYQNTKETHDLQKDLIKRQRDLITTQDENSDELRDLTQVSINDTRDLLNLNTNIINQLKLGIQQESNPQLALPLQQQLAQIQGGTNQLSTALRTSEFQVNEEGTARELENINRDIALKQLEVQEKALNLSLQAAGIQLQLAKVQEANMFPATPFSGTVQRVHVKVGDSVNPGTPLVTIAGGSGEVIIDAQVPYDIAGRISPNELATISINDRTIKLSPYYVSTEATSGQLYSVLFTIGTEYRDLFTDQAYVSVMLPVGTGNTTVTKPFIPVDSVFQTQNEAYVYIANGNRARSKKVQLGAVTGRFVAVESGLSPTDKVILTRTVVDGDLIRVSE